MRYCKCLLFVLDQWRTANAVNSCYSCFFFTSVLPWRCVGGFVCDHHLMRPTPGVIYEQTNKHRTGKNTKQSTRARARALARPSHTHTQKRAQLRRFRAGSALSGLGEGGRGSGLGLAPACFGCRGGCLNGNRRGRCTRGRCATHRRRLRCCRPAACFFLRIIPPSFFSSIKTQSVR